MQERCGREFSIDGHILGKALSHVSDYPSQQALPGGVLAIAGSVGLPIERQRQTGSHHADHHQRMLIAPDLLCSVLPRPTQVAALLASPSCTGAVDGQSDPAAVVE